MKTMSETMTRLAGILLAIVALAAIAFAHPMPAQAASFADGRADALVGGAFVAPQAGTSTFTATSGTLEGEPVEIGTALTFGILSEPQDGRPGTAQVGNGSSIALGVDYDGAVIIPDTVEHEGTVYQVVYCAASSFRLSKISAVTLPSTLTRIRTYAFYCCYYLKSVEFAGTPSLAYIEGHAFEVPSATGQLSTMRFPASLKSVGVYSFRGQSALEILSFEGKSLQFIGQYAFNTCKGLREAYIPELTSENSSLGAYCFAGCSNLEFVEFTGEVTSLPSELIGTRLFDDCTSLQTVVYRGKKVIPCWKYYGSASDLFYEFTASNPTLYFTITYYESKLDAEMGQDPIGAVCVRSDTPLCNIKPGMAVEDESGVVVYDGEPLALPEGYDAWCYEGLPSPSEAPSDSLYAFPADSHGLENASVTLDAKTYPYTGVAVMPAPTVCTAYGDLLKEGTDFECVYERQDEEGNWEYDSECIEIGSMRVTIWGKGLYEGSRTVEYTIAHAQEGDTFVSDGITYSVVEPTDGTFEGAASVGDGISPAIPTDTEGEVVIPSVVNPDGSLVSYKVTAVGKHAFGSSSTEGSCRSIRKVVLPDSITSIGTYAFGYCTKLKEAIIPASVDILGSRSFQNCTGLSSLVFEGSTISQIGTYCFANCTSLMEVELPSVSVFREKAFANCKKLSRVDFWGYVGQGDKTQFSGCTRLSRVVYHTSKAFPGTFPSNPTIYGVMTFKNTAGKVLGQATLKVGTPLKVVLLGIDKTYLLEGAVPAAPSGYGCWRISGSNAQTLSKTCTLVPTGLANGKTQVAGSGVTKAKYRVISNATRAVSYVACKSTKAAKATVPASIKLNGCTYEVTKVLTNAFKGTEVKTVTVQSKGITTFSKAFASSKVEKVVAPKAKKASYAKLLTKKACSRTVKVTWK